MDSHGSFESGPTGVPSTYSVYMYRSKELYFFEHPISLFSGGLTSLDSTNSYYESIIINQDNLKSQYIRDTNLGTNFFEIQINITNIHLFTTIFDGAFNKGYVLTELGSSSNGIVIYMRNDKLYAIAGGTAAGTYLETSISVFTGSIDNWNAIYNGNATIKMTLYQDSADFANMTLRIDDGTKSIESYDSINPGVDDLQIIGNDVGAIGGVQGTTRENIPWIYTESPRNISVNISRYYGIFIEAEPEPEPEAEPEPEVEATGSGYVIDGYISGANGGL